MGGARVGGGVLRVRAGVPRIGRAAGLCSVRGCAPCVGVLRALCTYVEAPRVCVDGHGCATDGAHTECAVCTGLRGLRAAWLRHAWTRVCCVCAVCVLCVCHVLRVLCAIGVAVLCTGGLHTCTYVLCVCYVCAMRVLCMCYVCAVCVLYEWAPKGRRDS